MKMEMLLSLNHPGSSISPIDKYIIDATIHPAPGPANMFCFAKPVTDSNSPIETFEINIIEHHDLDIPCVTLIAAQLPHVTSQRKQSWFC